MEDSHSIRSTISAMFLVAGTCIGGGMLALPIATGLGGFFPSLFVMVLCWFAMTVSALLLVEASLWFAEEVHLISIASKILGSWGKWACWVLYLFIAYASLIAYTAGGGLQFALGGSALFGVTIPKDVGCVLFIGVFGAVVLVGSSFVGKINSILFCSLIGAYLWLIGLGAGEVRASLLLHSEWRHAFIAVPLLLTAFSFQTLVPSLTPYLKRNRRSLRVAVIGGTLIAFLIYCIWQWIILGIVPVRGVDGLAGALAMGDLPVTQFLRNHVAGRWIYLIAEYFAFFAIVTSFLGIALGLFDFLADGLKVEKTRKGTFFLGFLMVAPTLLIATQYERVFIAALDLTGGFGDTLLNGIIPVLLVWKGRYVLSMPGKMLVPGGRFALFLAALFFGGCFILEGFALLGWTPSLYEPYDILEIHNVEEVQTAP